MKHALLLLVAVACKGKQQDPTPAPSTSDAKAVTAPSAPSDVPVTPATTPLEEAVQLASAHKHTQPQVWVAIARAQAVAKQTDAAKATLAKGLEAARKESDYSGQEALVHGVEVYLALGDQAAAAALLDEAVVAIQKESLNRQVLLRELLAPDALLVHVPLIERLVAIAVTGNQFGAIVTGMGIGSPAWEIMLKQVRVLPDVHERVGRLETVVQYARQSGEVDLAKKLAKEAAHLVAKKPTDFAVEALAKELAALGEIATAKRLVAHLPGEAAKAAKADPTDGAASIIYAELCELQARFGDAKASQALETKMAPAVKAAKEHLDEDDVLGGKISDLAVVPIVVARVLRGQKDKAVNLAKRMLRGDAIGEAAWVLVDAGEPDAAGEILAPLQGDALDEAVFDIVELQARRTDLSPARQTVEATKSGAQPLLRRYAYRGDVKSIEALSTSQSFKDVGFAIVARVFALSGKCEEALTAAKQADDRAETMAVIATYCPSSKL